MQQFCRTRLVRIGHLLKVSSYALNTTICRNGSKGIQHPFNMKSKKVIQKQQSVIDSINSHNQHEVLADNVTPYWKLSYEEELEMKQKICQDVLSQVMNKISPNREKGIDNILCNIIRSPVREAYRNKDEFSVWPGLDGDPKTVGFFVGSPAVGKVVCVPPTHIKCIKQSHKEIAQLYQDYIRSSPLPVSYQLYDGGFWRNIVIRSNDAGDHMALIITRPSDLSQELFQEQEKLLQEYFGQRAPSLSLFHQSCPHVKCSRDQAPIRHLSGQPYLMETMSGFVFRISPDSFFQLNKPAAELMFETVIDLLKPNHFTTLLDLYCGTGAVSMVASDRVRGCVGVEEGEAAVKDAAYNAEVNNISNCNFVHGRVEVKLLNVMKKLEHSSNLMAVVNPGRGGAGEGVMSLLRQNRHITRVVYISCRPDNVVAMKNFVQLCERVSSNSKPFHLTRAVPVDLFPYTSHPELVLCFDKT